MSTWRRYHLAELFQREQNCLQHFVGLLENIQGVFFAGGSSDPTRGVVWPTIGAIDSAFTIGLPLSDVVELTKLAEEFAILSHGELWGTVTAIDGWVAQTRKPFADEVEDIMAAGGWLC